MKATIIVSLVLISLTSFNSKELKNTSQIKSIHQHPARYFSWTDKEYDVHLAFYEDYKLLYDLDNDVFISLTAGREGHFHFHELNGANKETILSSKRRRIILKTKYPERFIHLMRLRYSYPVC